MPDEQTDDRDGAAVVRQDRVKDILASADARDEQADARDSVADGRDSAASLDSEGRP